MRAHIVEKGMVVNTIIVESLDFPVPAGQALVDGSDGGIGWGWDGEKFVAPIVSVPPAAAPRSVTPAQGLMALYVLKGITEDDILAAIANIDDPSMGYQALIAFKKATVWERASEALGVVAQLMDLTEQDKDDLFVLAATYTGL